MKQGKYYHKDKTRQVLPYGWNYWHDDETRRVLLQGWTKVSIVSGINQRKHYYKDVSTWYSHMDETISIRMVARYYNRDETYKFRHKYEMIILSREYNKSDLSSTTNWDKINTSDLLTGSQLMLKLSSTFCSGLWSLPWQRTSRTPYPGPRRQAGNSLRRYRLWPQTRRTWEKSCRVLLKKRLFFKKVWEHSSTIFGWSNFRR
jgi:hypothetical protein